MKWRSIAPEVYKRYKIKTLDRFSNFFIAFLQIFLFLSDFPYYTREDKRY